jgi:integrase
MNHLAPFSRLNWGRLVLRVLKAARPDMDWSGHRRAVQLLWRQATDHRSTRKDGRIISTAVLLKASRERYEAQGYGSAPADFQSAKARRDAVMVAFLAVLPIRRRAFCGLEIGSSLQRTATGLRVVLESEDLKVGPGWEAQVPSPLAELLADYLEHVRPVLQARGKKPTQALWLNEHGRPYNAIHLGARIREITFDLVGVRVTPHFFRDAAATTLAYASPESARLTRAILGHSSFRTAEQHYNQATGIEAGRQYADLIARLADKAS